MYNISIASINDFDGVFELLQVNSPIQGGTLTGDFSRGKVKDMIASGSLVIVARRDDCVVGVLFSSATNSPSASRQVKAMLSAWPGGPAAYVYGPVCISKSERGRGLLAQMYEKLRMHHPAGEAVLFIRRDNTASLISHQKLGMREAATFTLEDVNYAILSDGALSVVSG